MMEEEYQYEPLPGRRGIRLLQLFPAAHDGDPISATLHCHDLDSAPEFETISYVWGDPARARPIFCDEIPLRITKSLHDALVQFRLKSESRLLWADAICINQADLNERASQVVIMHHIYESSQRCLVWLGRADEHSPIALKVIQDMATILCRYKGIPVEDIDTDLNENGRDLMLTRKFRFDGLPPRDSQTWVSVFKFFGRPWYTRVWVRKIFFRRYKSFS